MTDQPEQYTLQLGDRGRIVLPATVREQLNLKEGDRLVLTLETDGSLRLTNLRELVKKAQGLFQDIKGVSLASELIQERREEALREKEL